MPQNKATEAQRHREDGGASVPLWLCLLFVKSTIS